MSAFGPIDRERRARRPSGSAARVVLQQHEALGRGAPGDVAVDRVVDATPRRSRRRRRRAGPVRSSSVSTRCTLSSSALLVDLARRAPRRRASSPNHCGGPGISRSRPAFAAGAVLCVPYQSDITTPSKPHSSRSDREQPRVLAAVRAVDAVVRGHHRPRAGLASPRPRTGRARSRAACARRPRS